MTDLPHGSNNDMGRSSEGVCVLFLVFGKKTKVPSLQHEETWHWSSIHVGQDPNKWRPVELSVSKMVMAHTPGQVPSVEAGIAVLHKILNW